MASKKIISARSAHSEASKQAVHIAECAWRMVNSVLSMTQKTMTTIVVLLLGLSLISLPGYSSPIHHFLIDIMPWGACFDNGSYWGGPCWCQFLWLLYLYIIIIQGDKKVVLYNSWGSLFSTFLSFVESKKRQQAMRPTFGVVWKWSLLLF